MIGEGLFIFLPTIIAITIAFFVGLGTGILIVGSCGVLYGFSDIKVPKLKTLLLSLLEEDQ